MVKYSNVLSRSLQRWMLTSIRNSRSMADSVWGRQNSGSLTLEPVLEIPTNWVSLN